MEATLFSFFSDIIFFLEFFYFLLPLNRSSKAEREQYRDTATHGQAFSKTESQRENEIKRQCGSEAESQKQRGRDRRRGRDWDTHISERGSEH